MAKTETTTEVVPSSLPEFSLDEFCARLSETVKSPEIIGGFHFSERKSGKTRDTFDAFKARFEAFRNQPV